MATPAEHDLVVYSGDTFTRTLTFTDSNGDAIDLSGQTVAMKIRASTDGAELADWASSWDTTNAATGVLVLTAAATLTDDLAGGVYVYDLELTNGSTVTTYMVGALTIVQDVTR